MRGLVVQAGASGSARGTIDAWNHALTSLR